MKIYYKFIQLVSCILFLSITSIDAAADLSIGFGGAWQSSPYKSHDDTFLPMPLVHYEGECFYIRGLEAGLRLWNNKSDEISFGFSYASLSFNSKKTKDPRLKNLDNRNPSLNAYLQYAFKGDYGQGGLRIIHDALANSKAFAAEAYYKYPFMLGPVYVSPGAGVRWDSKKQVNYYFGISSEEALRSGLKTYTASGGLSPFLSLEADWRFTDCWSIAAAGRSTFLNKEITNSPMVEDKQIIQMTIGLKYSF